MQFIVIPPDGKLEGDHQAILQANVSSAWNSLRRRSHSRLQLGQGAYQSVLASQFLYPRYILLQALYHRIECLTVQNQYRDRSQLASKPKTDSVPDCLGIRHVLAETAAVFPEIIHPQFVKRLLEGIRCVELGARK